MTSSRYAMRKKFTFAIREVFRGFPACFVHSDTRCDFELVSACMPHTRSQGPPPVLAFEEPEQEFHTNLRSRLSQIMNCIRMMLLG
ncbi:hypothetical protein E3N88_34641 [Mikania micrantha]|uniref:Uncharacterized protein n=1 Tax=Mikania micrantha TaxID=192012 RepID=A0A5N6LYY7_9ASTR|nr:hypothetical protein E3N88_34641 [Mikania micrantha]